MRNLKRALSLALATVMTLGLMVVGTGAVGYTDVTSEDNQEAIEVLQEVGIMTGVTEDEFNPDGLVTRNQMAVIMSQLLNLDYNYYRGINAFTDVPSWAAPYVAACVAEGVTAGIGNNLYGGENNITAAQAALMLMKALGYFQYQGDFNPDWQVATIRQGSYINLFEGVDANAEQALTRSQVAQMVLNALKANMVDFTGDVGTQLTLPDGTTYFSGYKAEYTARTNAAQRYNKIDTGTTNIAANDQYYVQLGEELYDGDLELETGVDVFGRPSNIWSYDGEEIGTYMNSELMVAEYTEAMTGEDLYNDIGRTADEKYNITVTMDGVEQALSIVNQIARRNDDDFTLSGTGVLTQVFVDVDEEEVYVSVINTYLAQATADYNDRRETASFEIWGVDRNSDGDYIKTAGSTEPSVSVSNDDVYVADIVEDEFVLVTLADGGIQSVADAEVVSDVTISAFSLNSYITADGNDYDYAETAMYAVGVLDAYDTQNLKEQTYNVYLDAYGNLIGLDIVDPADNYVFITGIEAPETSVLSNTTQKANAIFLDGTSKVIDVKAAKNAPALPTSAEEWHNQWYAYSESDGVYTLTLIDDNQSTDKVFQGYVEDTTAHTIDYAHTSLPIAAGGGNTAQRVYGNNDSVYLTADVDLITVSGNKHTIITKAANVVTGVRNASITTYTAADPIEVSEAGGNKNADSQLAHAAYVLFKSNGYIIGAVVVGSDDAISKNIVYVNSSQPSLEGYDSATGMWTWERKVILDGEEVVLRETSDVSTGGLTELSAGNMSQYSWYLVSYNADGFVTNAEIIDATEPATNLEYVSDYTGGAIQTAIDGSGIDAVVYEDSTNFSNVAEANLPTLIEQTLYLSTADADGFFLADDVKVVLIQQNNGKTTTEYNEGPSAVEAAISGLNAASDNNYDFVVNALIEDGAATVVIFEDVTNGGANLGDHSGNGDYSIAQDARFGGASNVNIAVNLEQGGNPVADGTDVTVTVQTYAQYTGWTDFAQYTITVDNGDGRLHLVNAANGIASQTSVRLVIETGDEPLVSNVIVKP